MSASRLHDDCLNVDSPCASLFSAVPFHGLHLTILVPCLYQAFHSIHSLLWFLPFRS